MNVSSVTKVLKKLEDKGLIQRTLNSIIFCKIKFSLLKAELEFHENFILIKIVNY
ncbi:MAG: MarR family transcriptional regulator [Methanobrevibacter sp.]|jgi:DNA-binding MarR family transcriptional regulator|nr:MarR family transcriptional regulator [Methanobrevibacter sp.]